MARKGSDRQLLITQYLQQMRCRMNRERGWADQGSQEEREAAFSRFVREYAWIMGDSHASVHQVFLYLRYVHELIALYDIQDPGPPTRYLPPQTRDAVIERDAHVCQYCHRAGGKRLGPDGKSWQIDHVVPLSRGGTEDLRNLALSCAECNLEKGAMMVADYLEARCNGETS